MDEKDKLKKKIGETIKTKSSMGATDNKKATDTASIQNIDFDLIKVSFISINESLDKINVVFENINNSLQMLVDQTSQQKYQQEEQELESKKQAAPMSQRMAAEKQNVADFFGNLKEFITNPAVLAGLAGIVYTVLPKETQERIKTFFGRFAGKLSDTTNAFGSLSKEVEGIGLALGFYLGGKFLGSIASAITTVINLTRAFGKLGGLSKGLLVGGAVYGALKAKDILSESSSDTQTHEDSDTDVEKKLSDEYYHSEKYEKPIVDENNKPVAVVESKPEVSPTPETTKSRPEAGSREERMQVALGNIPPTVMGQAPQPVPTNKPSVAGTSTPMSTEMGALSERYESGGKGSSAIGWDSTGGTSYGRYQIASKTGAMDDFLSYAKDKNPEVYNRLKAAGPSNAGKESKFAQEWTSLAQEGKLAGLEEGFVKQSHYDVAMKGIRSDRLKELIDNNTTLQQVLWSTSVQHGGSGAASIFNKAYKENMTTKDLVSAVYAERKTKFGSSTEQVRQGVQSRFVEEERRAVASLEMPAPPIQTAMAPTPRSESGFKIASLSTKNEAMFSSRTLAPQVQTINNNSSSQIGKNSYDDPMPIPSPIANRGSLYGTSTHSTQYA